MLFSQLLHDSSSFSTASFKLDFPMVLSLQSFLRLRSDKIVTLHHLHPTQTLNSQWLGRRYFDCSVFFKFFMNQLSDRSEQENYRSTYSASVISSIISSYAKLVFQRNAFKLCLKGCFHQIDVLYLLFRVLLVLRAYK